jgi:ATP-dependent Clp endopeptidase proteolytic subunit ClpP
MSEEDKRTPEEITAGIKKTEAEIKKSEAEAKQALAEARKADAEAEKAEIELEKARIDADKAKKCRDKELAGDEENHVYRFDGEVSKNSVQRCMSRLGEWSRLDPKCQMEIVFASPGGEIVSGFELFDFIQVLRHRGHYMVTGTLGMAASMAGILLQAGDERWMGHQSWVMIHRAAFGAWGKTFEIEDEVKFVKRIEERIIDIFTDRSNLSKQKIKRNWERKDWWISAEECVEMGLVDKIKGMMPEHKPKKKGKK